MAGLTGCPTTPVGGSGESGSGGITFPIDTETEGSTGALPGDESSDEGSGEGGSSTTAPPPDPFGTTDDGSSSGGSTDDGDSSTTEGPSAQPVDCGGTVYACTDGLDNDGDGLFDLDDPECISPCDDDELTFQTGIPGDNMDCKQDCFFDGNSGAGDDGCEWNLRCDPTNPGGEIGCGFTGGNNCEAQADPTAECLAVCQPLVPPGCDCFGCCTIDTEQGEVSIFLNSGSECSLSNLGGCSECTPQDDICGNPCDAEGCELCFGQTELPAGCEEQVCDVGMPCEDHAECGAGEFCFLGCCLPEPAG